MRVLVSIQSHFQAKAGEVFSHHLTHGRFWKRYLSVFDEVVVLGRTRTVDRIPDGWSQATGPGVRFAQLPDYTGPWQYLRARAKVVRVIRASLKDCNAVILRLPCPIGTMVWKNLPTAMPYGVEVVGDPWEGFSAVGMKTRGRAFYRWQWTRNLKAQCAGAAVAAYVTAEALQRRYPPAKDAFATHYSSIDLPAASVISELGRREARIKTVHDRLKGRGEPVHVGFIGSFSQGHKLPDVHIKAVAECIGRGANLTLEMIGDGGTLEAMKELARNLGIGERVHFHGRLPGGETILKAIDEFDLFLNATATEGLPRVIIEAMARGCPSVGSAVGGMPELLEDRWLVPPADAAALAGKIMEVLEDSEAMGKAARRNTSIARRYCSDVLQSRREALYRALRQRTEDHLNRLANRGAKR